MIWKYVIFSFLAYFLGSIPFSYIIPKVFKGTDIREHGSGNVGASNAMRVCGPAYGLASLVLDVGKGAAATYIALIGGTPIVLGALAILGHITTPFLKFSGGKGVATAIGVIVILSWKAALIAAGIWITVVLLLKISSVSSLLAILSVPITLYITGEPRTFVWTSLGILITILITHRENIQRLSRGEENKVIQ